MSTQPRHDPAAGYQAAVTCMRALDQAGIEHCGGKGTADERAAWASILLTPRGVHQLGAHLVRRTTPGADIPDEPDDTPAGRADGARRLDEALWQAGLPMGLLPVHRLMRMRGPAAAADRLAAILTTP